MLVLGFDYLTFAATGGSMILGKNNRAGKTTTLKNTGAGPALALTSRRKAPPLKVSSSKKVARLHADLLDGKSAGDLGTRIYRLEDEVTGLTSYTNEFPSIPNGTYAVTYTVTMTDAIGTAAAPRNNECYFDVKTNAGIDTKRGYATSTSTGYYPGLTGTTVLTNPRNWVFTCATSIAWDSTYSPIEIIFTKVDTVTNLAPDAFPRPASPRRQ